MQLKLIFAVLVALSLITASESCWLLCFGSRSAGSHGRHLPYLPCNFKFYDRNRDGILTKREFFAALDDKKLPQNRKNIIFAGLDTNVDGRVRKEEFERNIHRLGEKVFESCDQ